MTTQEELAAGLKNHVGPALRTQGYRGSGRTWRRANEHGDVAVVNVQSSMFNTAAASRCVVNLALVPGPWMAWNRFRHPRMPQQVTEADGAYRLRLHPTGSPPGIDTWWEFGEDGAEAAARDIATRVLADGVPLLERLLDRPTFLDAVRRGDLGFATGPDHGVLHAMVEAALLSEDGPSPALDSALGELVARSAPESEALRAQTDQFATWVRERASAAPRR